MINRREFLHGSAAALTVAGLTSEAAPAPGEWHNRPMRWAQLTLVEDDPGNYDLQFWLDYFRRTHSDAACLSAGGCVAYYPTKVPLHYRSRFLGDRDCFGDLVAGCRKLGMNVIARTDPHAVHQDVYDAHPDWIAVDAQGRKRKHWADPELWVTCALGPYNFDFMTAVTKEIVTLYQVDGIFSNRWAGSGMCYCEHCQANFKKFSGLELPRTGNPQDPARRQYIFWHQQRLFELWKLWDGEIKKINPELYPERGRRSAERPRYEDGRRTGADAVRGPAGAAGSDAAVVQRQEREGIQRHDGARKAIAGIFSMGIEEPYRWKDSVQNKEEIQLWIVDGVAHNLRPWFTKFNGKVLDQRWMKPVEDTYVWHYKNERYLRNERSLARVALVYSQQTAQFYGGEQARAKVEDHAMGFYQALVEARIPFDMVHDHLLDAAHIAQYRTLILPNLAALSNEQCRQIAEYVRGGGNIVATHETSLYDEWGVRRSDFGLAAMFGANFDGEVDTDVHNSYLNVDKDPQTGLYHPIVRGLEDAHRIINGAKWVHTRPAHPGPAPLTLVPSYPDLPMESVWARVPRTDIPGLYAREEGRGRVVYFPFDLDRTFWEVLSNDHGLLLRNALAWAHNEEQPLSVEGKGVLDVSLWMQKDSIAAHLVNLTNPMMMKGPLREILPSPPQRVKIRVPQGRRPQKVSLLVSGKTPGHRISGNVITLEIPSIELHEVVAIDLA